MVYGIGNYDISGYNNAYVSPYSVRNEQEAKDAGLNSAQIRGLKKAGQIECSTCANRMYQDGSDENVSFKSAAHLSPTAEHRSRHPYGSMSRVR